MYVAILFKPRVSGVVLKQGKGAPYRETMQATRCYTGRTVIATAAPQNRCRPIRPHALAGCFKPPWLLCSPPLSFAP